MKKNLFKNREILFCNEEEKWVREKECDTCAFFKDKETSYYKSLKYWYDCQEQNLDLNK